MRREGEIIGKVQKENIGNGIREMPEFGRSGALDSDVGLLPIGDYHSRSCLTRMAGAATFIAGISHWNNSVAPKAPAN